MYVVYTNSYPYDHITKTFFKPVCMHTPQQQGYLPIINEELSKNIVYKFMRAYERIWKKINFTTFTESRTKLIKWKMRKKNFQNEYEKFFLTAKWTQQKNAKWTQLSHHRSLTCWVVWEEKIPCMKSFCWITSVLL